VNLGIVILKIRIPVKAGFSDPAVPLTMNAASGRAATDGFSSCISLVAPITAGNYMNFND